MPLPEPNDKTLDAYNEQMAHYISHTPSKHLKSHTPLLHWIDESLKLIPQSGDILEIGSGTGRDAQYIRSKGCKIICSDGAQSFVDYLKSMGEPAVTLNILKDDIPGLYDMVLANAVVPHFTTRDLKLTLVKVKEALKPNGVFAFSAKQGEGSSWVTEKFDTERYIHYWQPKTLCDLVTNLGYEVVFLEDNIPGDLPTHTWINLTIRKTD
jgi:2-polyprenyl-3-methyl-5-hydroxy-6-metoxy-1,4-benzoquinol methylase